jgi:hypothetical protein
VATKIDWSDDMDSELRAGRSRGWSWDKCAESIGVHVRTAQSRAAVLGLPSCRFVQMVGRAVRPGHAAFDTMEDFALRLMAAQGATAQRIAYRFGTLACIVSDYCAGRDIRLAGEGELPPGHPISWGIITAGTVLDGSPYHANT